MKPTTSAALVLLAFVLGRLMLKGPLGGAYAELCFVLATVMLISAARKVSELFGGNAKKVWQILVCGFVVWLVGDLIFFLGGLFPEGETLTAISATGTFIFILGNLILAYGLLSEADRLPFKSGKNAVISVAVGLLFLSVFSGGYLYKLLSGNAINTVEKTVVFFITLTDASIVALGLYLFLIYGGIFREAWKTFSAGSVFVATGDALAIYLFMKGISDRWLFLSDCIWAVGYALLWVGMWKITQVLNVSANPENKIQLGKKGRAKKS